MIILFIKFVLLIGFLNLVGLILASDYSGKGVLALGQLMLGVGIFLTIGYGVLYYGLIAR